MRILVTGAAGFVGRHLTSNLAQHRHDVIASDLAEPDRPIPGVAAFYKADLRDRDAVEAMVRASHPDACVHLGAIAFVPSGHDKPDTMLAVNIAGSTTLLESLLSLAPTCKTLVVSTAQIYAPDSGPCAIPETAPLAPCSLYAVSKAAADMAALGYARRFGMPVLTARPNNHTGPGQAPRFVIPSLIRQVRAIAAGQAPPVIHAGNLDSQRAFADVRDVVEAYRLLLECGKPGEAYNIAAGTNKPLGVILDTICAMAGIRAERRQDPDKVRPTDQSPVLDTRKLQSCAGWAPRISFDQTLRDMLDEETCS